MKCIYCCKTVFYFLVFAWLWTLLSFNILRICVAAAPALPELSLQNKVLHLVTFGILCFIMNGYVDTHDFCLSDGLSACSKEHASMHFSGF